MKNYTLKTLGVLATCSVLLSSCADSFDTSFFEKEIVDPELQIALPVGYVSYTATELFEELGEDLTVGETQDGTNSLISFTYSESLSGSGNDDFVKVDNQGFEGEFKLFDNTDEIPDGDFNYALGTVSGDQVEENFYEIEPLTQADNTPLNEDFKQIQFRSGNLAINLFTNTSSETVVTFTIPSLIRKSDNSEFSETFVLNNNSGSDITLADVDLSEYMLELTYDSLNPKTKNGFNNLAVELNAIINFEENDAINKNNLLAYTITTAGLEIEAALGDFKNRSFQVNNQTFELDFFEELGDGNIAFKNPTLKISANNTYGFPIGLELDNISTNANTNNNLMIIDNGSTNDHILKDNGINYVVFDAGTSTDGGVTSTSTTTEIILNNKNSNLVDLLNQKPTEFNLNVSGIANPGATTTNDNFFNPANSLDVTIDVEIPLHASFDGLSFSEEIDFDNAEDIQENAKSITLDVRTINAMPLAGTIQLQFLDNQNNNLGIDKTVEAFNACPIGNDGYSTGSIDANGTVTGTISDQHTELVFTENEIDLLAQATKINLIVTFNSTDNNGDNTPDAIKLRTTDTVRMQLGLVGDLKFSDNE
ncbi:hypothetical protein [Ochrovirga pacifica]|uniref:hypothetical protein n=1 Tax=Ochrovirga pacifica TaxID=1042376 RepID=UPI00025591D1|nr:hypothetical protein [Ochrovirga pacifica]